MSRIEGEKPFLPSDDDSLGDPPSGIGYEAQQVELAAAKHGLITSGPDQNVDRMVAWVATAHGLPVSDEYVRPPEVPDRTGWHLIDGELYPPEYFG